jgi:hypothetical protein
LWRQADGSLLDDAGFQALKHQLASALSAASIGTATTSTLTAVSRSLISAKTTA